VIFFERPPLISRPNFRTCGGAGRKGVSFRNERRIARS
jgi:hypothetical protein